MQAFDDAAADRMYADGGVSFLEHDPLVGARLGHEIWAEIDGRSRVYFPPDSRDLYLELYADFNSFSADPQRYRRYGGRPENTYFTDDGGIESVDGYPRPDLWTADGLAGSDDPLFDFQDKSVSQTVVSGSASTEIGTRFWFEVKGPDPGSGVAEINPIRIPAPEALGDDIRSMADEIGAEITRTKGAVFEERFDLSNRNVNVDAMDYHLKYENATSRGEIVAVFQRALDLTERAARMGR